MKTLDMLFPLLRTWIVFLLFMWQSFEVQSTTSATTGSGNETDHLALLEFKAKIIHDPQNIKSSWNDTIHFCNWEGVICSRRHKRVTILDLSSKGLEGSLSPYIGNMSFLRAIRLQNNSFQGEIPAEVGRLFRLEILNLNNNSFEGTIPSNLSKCLNIMYLGLGYSRLVGNIPVEFTAFSKLRKMVIHDNYLSGGIPPFVGNLSSLELLSAAGNIYGGSIPPSLGELKHLSFLGLGINNLSGTVPPPIYNISSITILSIPDNSLHGSFPPNIGLLLPNLEALQVSSNNFSGTIPVSLSNASKLHRILLDDNKFNGKILVDFGGLQQLDWLDLSGNNLGDKGDLNFITSLLNCSNLRGVDIANNQLKGVLPKFVSNLSSSLEWLLMTYNQVHGCLPPWLSTLINLSFIDLGINQITGNIPIEIGRLPRLQRLHLDSNRLFGPIPSSIGNLSLLLGLNLGNNNLQGTIPSSFGNFNNLLFLSLSQNNLTGSIPKQFFPLQSGLVLLSLDQNHLDGSLPLEIGNLFNLKELYVSHNMLSGEIPEELSQCNSLEFLYMDNNNFQGTLPPSLAFLKGLRKLELSHNNFSGEIPEYLEKLALEFVNLSFNSFEGNVPIKGVFTNASAISVSGNNGLCGGIPELLLPRCPVEALKRSKRRPVKIVLLTISCVSGITILSIAMYCMLKKKKRAQSSTSLQMKSFQKISYEMLLKATDRFSSTNLIGVGSFGSVYKGTFVEDGAIFAVKVFNLQQRDASKSFMAECHVLRNVRHRNLVKVITSCSSIDFQGNDFKALVYDYMPNGNLKKWLHTDLNDERPSLLSLQQRLNIAIDVGHGLDYLHHHCQKPIVHCDLKPSNILLDSDMVAHLGDFGLAKFLPHLVNPTQSSSIGVRGTIGYAAPEYGLGSEVSINGDVYSYGILLLEMVTGKETTDDIFIGDLNLHNFAKMAMPNQVMKIIDPILLQEDEGLNNSQGPAQARNNSKVECVICMIKVGIACSMESPQDRMDIRDAIKELHSVRNYLM